MENKEEKLTQTQFDSLHLWFGWLAIKLQEEGHDMRKTLPYPIIPTKESIKEIVFKPILLATCGKKSTKDLRKQIEIDQCYDIICKAFAEIGISVPPFPSKMDLIHAREAEKYGVKRGDK